jgi:hypothetical protein
MRTVRLAYYVASEIPFLLLLVARFAPPGTDPRGYGPPLVWLMVSAAASLALLLLGAGLCAFEYRAHRAIRALSLAALIAGIPFFLLLFAMFA